MMWRGARTPLGGITVGLALLAGCRTTTPLTPDPNALGVPEKVQSLSGSQIADVQVALARTVESRGEVRQAMGFYAEAVRKDPKRADAWARLAVLADREGMFTESDEYHRRALELQPNDPDLHCNRGYSLHLQGRWDEAEASLRCAVGLKPDHRRAHNNLGLVLARTGRGTEALVCFRNAGCSPTDAHTNLAYGLTLNGDWAGARKQYELALKLSPASDLARRRLEQLDTLAAEMDPTGKPPRQAPARSTASVVTPAAGTGPGLTAPAVLTVPTPGANLLEPRR